MHSLGSKHWQAVKRIFCYFQGTIHLGLFYPKGGMAPDLHAFLDSDWAGCYDKRVSTSGFFFLLGTSCISWLSKKHPTMATSSCEAQYKPSFIAIIECVWLKSLLVDLGVGQQSSTTICTNSLSTLVVCKKPCVSCSHKTH